MSDTNEESKLSDGPSPREGGEDPAAKEEQNENSNPLSGPNDDSTSGNAAASNEEKEKGDEVVIEEGPMHYDLKIAAVKSLMERREMDQLNELGGLKHFEAVLETDIVNGVQEDSLEKRREQFGTNVLNKREPATFLEFLVEAFQDEVIQILAVAAALSIIFGMTLPNPHSGHVERETGWIEGTAIFISILVVTLTGSINNYQKAKKFEEMEQEDSVQQLSVVRNGKEIVLDSNEVVVGDVLSISEGQTLSVDGLYIEGQQLKTNESALTGEPDVISKGTSKNPFLISGSDVVEGHGKILVVAVGMKSYQGFLKESLDEDGGDTPLQEHLGELAELIGKFGFGAAALLFVALSIKEVILITTQDKRASPISFLNFILIAITLIAVAIPEGLPLAVTISLAFSMKAMMEEECMVRILASCETMGAATTVCSDKTGTLTTNKMTVVQGLIFEEEFMFLGYGLEARAASVNQMERSSPLLRTSPQSVERLCYAISVNSTATEQEKDGEVRWTGPQTERGLLGFVQQVGHSYKDQRESAKDNMKQFPFMSQKKRMTTLVRGAGSSDSARATAYVKGAGEMVLEDCDTYVDFEGNVAVLTDEKKAQFLDIIMDSNKQGNRTISVAYKDIDGPMDEFPEEEPEGLRYTFLGALGIQDPIREEVPKAVADCNRAHLVVRMVTGDNLDTGIAIARKCGIYQDNGFDLAMTGPDFDKQANGTAEEREKLIGQLPRLRVLARSSPGDKHTLVGLVQEECGEVVGVTGDGTNDAPALKLANVGFAMRSGTQIATAAADMVLRDDNFATVVTAIRWGRAVNDNIKKFLQFQLAINVGGVMLTLVGSLASKTSKEPFTPVQLLWLNLIMDTLAAIALATELPEDACLDREPVYKQAPLITNHMRLFIGVHAVYQFTVILLILFLGHDWFNTVENENLCDKGVGPFGNDTMLALQNDTVVTGALNATTFNVYNISKTAITREYCDSLCTHVGGVLHGRRCQQGDVHSTMIFNTFIWFQIFNVFNARKIYGELNCFEGIFSRSKNLLIVFGGILALQVFAVEVAGPFMGTTGLTWDRWLICVGIGATALIIGFFQRLVPVKDEVPDIVDEKKARLQELHNEHLHKTHHHDPSLARRGSVTKRRRSSVVAPPN